MVFKKGIFSFIIFLLFFGMVNGQVVDSLYKVGTWQGFRSAAVTFTFDDNTPNQISVVLPIFDKYGYKMTFFPVINWGPNWTALQTAALNGHEIGSHTVSHSDLSALDDEQQTMEFKDSQDAINAHITGQKCLTIAYPYCIPGNSEICKRYYLAGRTCSGAIVSKTPKDFMSISSFVCGSKGSIQKAGDFNNKANTAALSKGWVVFLIHAIDDESGYSPTSSEEINSALDYLSQNDNKFWVSTFSNVARYIKERNAISVKEISKEDSLITLNVSDTLDTSIYNIPVTIRRVLPLDWPSAKVIQNNREINSKITSENEKKYIMFDIVPDSNEIQLKKETLTWVPKHAESRRINWILKQNYPNPFNPVTTITYQIAEKGAVSLKVYDILGRVVTTLVNENQSPGKYSVQFDGGNLNSGIYLYKLESGKFSHVKKLMFIK